MIANPEIYNLLTNPCHSTNIEKINNGESSKSTLLNSRLNNRYKTNERHNKVRSELGARSSLIPNPASLKFGQYLLDGKSIILHAPNIAEKDLSNNEFS